MDEVLPAIDVRSVNITDALALHKLDYSFETDRILFFTCKWEVGPKR